MNTLWVWKDRSELDALSSKLSAEEAYFGGGMGFIDLLTVLDNKEKLSPTKWKNVEENWGIYSTASDQCPFGVSDALRRCSIGISRSGVLKV